MHILIADDEPDLCETLKLLLQMRGHEVSTAANGQEAVSTAAENKPDVIVMDVNMPVMDGITATRLLRAKPETAGIPVICTSGISKGSIQRVRLSSRDVWSACRNRWNGKSSSSCSIDSLPVPASIRETSVRLPSGRSHNVERLQ